MQVSRAGCELILTEQWPERAGSSVQFVSLDADGFATALKAIAENGVAIADGHWGYPLKIVTDPDGNELWFPQQQDLPPPSAHPRESGDPGFFGPSGQVNPDTTANEPLYS